MYFLGTMYSCWKVLTRETSYAIYYLSFTSNSTELLFGCSFPCFHSSAKKAQESKAQWSDG